VNTQVPSDPSAALKQVGAGRAELAISYQPTILQARDEGIPVVATGAIVGQPLNSIIARDDRDISRPRDLEGKTVGWPGIPINRPFLDTAVRADGGDPSKVELRSVGFGLTPALASGRVDAIVGAYWNIELVELEERDIAASDFRLEDFGVPNYDELVVVASEKVLDENPDVVRRFLAGLAAGQERAAEDPEFATEAVLEANPDLEEKVTAEQVDITAPLLTQEGQEPLALDPAAWAEFASWMQDNDLLGDVDVDAAVTDEYLPTGT
jgi:ABC-type nitrate/sulfonate/bicarbonate transport system substrate-binding protein